MIYVKRLGEFSDGELDVLAAQRTSGIELMRCEPLADTPYFVIDRRLIDRLAGDITALVAAGNDPDTAAMIVVSGELRRRKNLE